MAVNRWSDAYPADDHARNEVPTINAIANVLIDCSFPIVLFAPVPSTETGFFDPAVSAAIAVAVFRMV